MKRTRRLRSNETMRSMVRENYLHPSDLIYPMFIVEGENLKNPVASMPGIYQFSIDRLEEELDRVWAAGVRSLLLFGIPAKKDEKASQAYNPDGVVQEAIRFIKMTYPGMVVISDICLCEYTSHGHCGLICGEHILNDETLPLLAKMAVTCADAGADVVAPSDMMDGRVAAIREALDQAGHKEIPVMSYSAKYASAYYGPFRDAAESAPAFGDRKTYQMDPANGKEALIEVAADIEEGADMIIVKPALAYMDILKSIADMTNVPLAVYNVSGEYAMVKAASANGWIDERRIVMENLTAMKRAGAKMIITYHAIDAGNWLKEDWKQYL